ncbi:MAG: Panacea domain-containing protein [Pseudomonadota bacterium]
MADLSIHETYHVERGALKFRELILYVAGKSEADEYFGATKLNKILYYSDFRAFSRLGSPITGVRYFKLPQGPAPKSLLPVQKALVEEGAIKVEERPFPGGKIQKRPIALRKPALSLFTGDELAIVDEVIEDLWEETAQQVSDASHDVRWRAVNMRDAIPYEFVHLSNDQVTTEDRNRTEELARRFGW